MRAIGQNNPPPATVQWRSTRVAVRGQRARPGPWVWLASNPLQRLRGVLFQEQRLHIGGCLLVNCAAVHGFGIRRPLDVVGLNRANEVLSVHTLKPCGWLVVPGAFSLLELAHGQADRWFAGDGQTLTIRDYRPDQLPPNMISQMVT